MGLRFVDKIKGMGKLFFLMRRERLLKLKKWCEETGGDLREFEDRGKKNLQCVFKYGRQTYNQKEGKYVDRPKVYVRTDGNSYTVKGGQPLSVTESEWEVVGGEEKNFQEKEVTGKTGTQGGELQVSVWGDNLEITESSRDGWTHKIEVEVE